MFYFYKRRKHKSSVSSYILSIEQHGRLYISRYPSTVEHSSYINAVRVDGFRSPERFIVTQQPMPNTLGDFWRLVAERETTVIVSLNSIDENDEVCIKALYRALGIGNGLPRILRHIYKAQCI